MCRPYQPATQESGVLVKDVPAESGVNLKSEKKEIVK